MWHQCSTDTSWDPTTFWGWSLCAGFFPKVCKRSPVRCTGHTNTAWGRAAPQTELSSTVPGPPESLTATFLICGPANQRSCSRTALKISVLYAGRSATAFLITSSTDFRVQAAPMVIPVNKQRKRIVVLQNFEVQKDSYCVCKSLDATIWPSVTPHYLEYIACKHHILRTKFTFKPQLLLVLSPTWQ